MPSCASCVGQRFCLGSSFSTVFRCTRLVFIVNSTFILLQRCTSRWITPKSFKLQHTVYWFPVVLWTVACRSFFGFCFHQRIWTKRSHVVCSTEAVLDISTYWKPGKNYLTTIPCFKKSGGFRFGIHDKFSSQFAEMLKTLLLRYFQWIFIVDFVLAVEKHFEVWWCIQILWNLCFL